MASRSNSCHKHGLKIRAMCTPIATIIAFSLMLTYIFILYQPSRGPGIKQKVGWQSWEVVRYPQQSSTGDQSPTEGTTHNSSTSIPDHHTDWWNVTKPEAQADLSSLPLDVWSPLLPHDTGLSEIAVTRCFVNPSFAEEFCAPKTSGEQDAIRGKWVRVDRNLNLEGGYMSGHLSLYYRRTRRQDVKLITEIRLLSDSEYPPTEGIWHKADTSLRSGISGFSALYLWYKAEKTAGEMSAAERASLVTELDVLYGEDIPWYGFEKLEPPTIPEKGKVEATWITYRRGVKVAPRAPPLHFSHDGKFKILQVADLHFSVSQGVCRDTSIKPCQHSDNMTLSLISSVLDAEKPDLVVFTGDQLNGQGTTWDAKSVLAKFSRAVTDKGIPWAAVFGNHDEDDGFKKEDQITLMKALPYSLVERGPKDVHGVGNYVLKVYSPDPSKTHTLTLYFLDSGSYAKGFIDWFGFFTPTEYDYIRQSQTDWFLQESASIRPIERPFTPDTEKDFSDIWGRQDQVTPNKVRLAKPNALMFYHIPIPETYSRSDMNPTTGASLDVGTTGKETPGSPKGNEGFFANGLMKAMESNHVSSRNVHEVKAIGNGHCHLTDNCRRVGGVWFCFGGGGSYSGYGKIGFDRRFRVYDVSDYGETIRTYKRTEKGEIVDQMTLAGSGAAPLW